MPNTNPNNLDFFNKGEVFSFIKGKAGTSPNNFDFFNKGEVFGGILQDDVQISSPPIVAGNPPRRRIFLID